MNPSQGRAALCLLILPLPHPHAPYWPSAGTPSDKWGQTVGGGWLWEVVVSRPGSLGAAPSQVPLTAPHSAGGLSPAQSHTEPWSKEGGNRGT